MKIFRYLTMFAAAAGLATSCELEPKDLFSTDPVAPVLTAHNAIVLADQFDEQVSFSWSAPRNVEGDAVYSIAAAYDADYTTLAEGLTNLYYTTTKGEFREFLIDVLGVPADEQTPKSVVNIQVTAVCGTETLVSEAMAVQVVMWLDNAGGEGEDVAFYGWSVIGANNDWDNDIAMAMVDNGLWISPIIAIDTEISNELKLRFNHGWDVNRGENVELTLGTAVGVVNNGGNLKVAASGSYFIVYNEVAETVTIYDGANGWGLVGDALPNDWGNDSYKMLEFETGVFKTAFTVGSGQFKMRYDNDWTDKDTYCEFTDYKVPAEAQHGGNNIQLPDSNVEIVVTYNTNNETVVVEKSSARNMAGSWGVIGVGGDWDNDVYMYQVDATTWRSVPFVASAEFKLRFGGEWGINERAGGFEELGKPFACPNGDGNIYGLDEIVGNVVYVVYDSANETMTIDNVK